MVDRLDLKTGDKLTEAAFATVDSNFADLDSGKAAKSDIPEVPDVSKLATKSEVATAVKDKADASDVTTVSTRVDNLAEAKADKSAIPDVSDLATKDEITSAVSGLASESIVSALADRVAALETPAGE